MILRRSFFIFFVIYFTNALPSSFVAKQDGDMYRPQIHYSISEHWLNDPNGMVYYDGEYHLYYQHHPYSAQWGPMHWGHAVSTDLVSWTELPIALYPDDLGQIWSGSGVVDLKNSSGFQTDPETAPIIAVFTHAAGSYPQQQSIAFSNDRGRTFTKYSANPVIPNPGLKRITFLVLY
jgi:fructan beta-fructosidase